MAYLASDQKWHLYQVIKRDLQAKGFSPMTAAGMALEQIDRDGFAWEKLWPPSATDKRLMERVTR